MSRQIIDLSACDWCAAVGIKNVPAVHERPVPKTDGKAQVADLCVPCTMLWDLITPRLDFIRARLDVLDTLYRSARHVQDSDAEPPARVRKALPAQTAPETTPAPPTPPDHTPPHVLCMDCEPPAEVPYNQRRRHARSHHNTGPHAVVWQSGTAELEHPCRVHQVCDETGYAFTVPQARAAHERASLPDEQPPKTPQQTTLPDPGPPLDKPASRYARGLWQDGIAQIGCPLEHQPGAPNPYWVRYPGRSEHARKHGLKARQIAWFTREDDPFQLNWPCTVHEECQTPPYAFPSEVALERHYRSVGGRTPRPANT